MLSHNPPPFHAEHIGSLLRPSKLLDQRAKFARGEIDRTELTKAEDEAIKDALALQRRVGLKLATDGEFRRRSYHSFFYRQLGEISIDTVGGEDAQGGEPGRRAAQPVALVNSRVRWSSPINVPDFHFIRAHSGLVPKVTIPGPCALHFPAATGLSWRTLTRTSMNSGTTSSRRFAMSSTRSAPLAVDTSRSTRRRSPSSAIPKSGNGCMRAAMTGAPSSTNTSR